MGQGMLRIGMMALNGRSGKDSASPLGAQGKGEAESFPLHTVHFHSMVHSLKQKVSS